LLVEKFIADRITGDRENKGNISRPIVKIGILGISLGMAVMLLTVSIVPGFKKEITSRITGLTADIIISNINVTPGSEQQALKLSPDTIAKLKALPLVKHIQPTAFKNGLLRTERENEGVLLKGTDSTYDFAFLRENLLEGRIPQFNGSLPSKDIFISASLASRLGLNVDDKVETHFISTYEVYDADVMSMVTRTAHRSRKFTVCGIFKTDFSDFDERLGIVDLRQIQKVNMWDSTSVGSYEILVKDYEKLDDAAEPVREIVGYNYNVSTVRETYNNIFVWLDKLDVNGVIVVALMVAVAVMNMVTALLILILERSNMIGLVKALGMPNLRVRRLFFLISLRLTGKGLLWGNIVGIGLCLIQYYFRIATLESETYYVDFVAIDINWLFYLILNVGTFLVCCLVLYLPTLLVTRLTPVRTLKFD
jgi:lipoprotein-releasing system permease protein